MEILNSLTTLKVIVLDMSDRIHTIWSKIVLCKIIVLGYVLAISESETMNIVKADFLSFRFAIRQMCKQ